jgi:hypothetical protein
MSKIDRRTKLTDAQQTSQVHELTDVELDSVNGSRGSLLGAVAMSVVDAVAEGVVFPLIRAGLV